MLDNMCVDDPRNALLLCRHLEFAFDHRKLTFVLEAGSDTSEAMILRVEVHPDWWDKEVCDADDNNNILAGKRLLVSDRQVTILFRDVHGVRIAFSGSVPFRRALVLHSAACYMRDGCFTPPTGALLELCTKSSKKFVVDAVRAHMQGKEGEVSRAPRHTSTFVCDECKNLSKLSARGQELFYCQRCWERHYATLGLCQSCGSSRHKWDACPQRLLQ